MRAMKPRITGLLTSALYLHSESSCATSLVVIVLARAEFEPPRGDGVQRHEHEMDAAGTIHADITREETVVRRLPRL